MTRGFMCQVAGSVIGKGGSNIQKLRSEHNAQVRIPDCPGPERVMAIQAGDMDSVVGILRMAIPFMYEQGEEDDGGDRELRLLIHQSIVGGIIGKSGSKSYDVCSMQGLLSSWPALEMKMYICLLRGKGIV